MATIVAALNLGLSVWALRYTFRKEPTSHGTAARVRWGMVAACLALAAVAMLLWGGSLLGEQVCFVGFFLAGVFLVFRSLSAQLVASWGRIILRSRH